MELWCLTLYSLRQYLGIKKKKKQFYEMFCTIHSKTFKEKLNVFSATSDFQI